MSTTVVFSQLAAENFNNWKFRVRAFMEEKQLEDALVKEIGDFSEEKDRSEFKVKDAKAKSIIVQCVSDKHLDIIKDSTTAKQMLKALEEIFQRKSVFSKLTLKKKLLTMKCGKGETLEDHFLKFDTLIRELEDIGSKMNDSDKVCHLLLTLNDDYDSVITAIETLNTNITMEFVKSRLLDEELKQKTKFKTVAESTFKTESLNYGNRNCFQCGKPGHRIAECRQNTNKNKQGVRQGYTKPSFNPRGTNHNRGQRGSYRGQKRGYNHSDREHFMMHHETNDDSETDSSIAFVAANFVSKMNENTFILDSGATEHLISSDHEHLMKNVRVLTEEVSIGTARYGDKLISRKRGSLTGKCQGKVISSHSSTTFK